MTFRGSGKTSRPRRRGKGQAKHKRGKHQSSPSNLAVKAPESGLHVPEQDSNSRGKDCEGLQQDGHQTLSLKGHLGPNSGGRPSDSNETHSNRPKHARKRSHSLPADFGSQIEEKHRTRAETVTLLRARTLSRLSESDRSFTDSISGLLSLEPNPPCASVRAPVNTMVREEASIMDFVTNKKPKKKSKSKKKKKGTPAISGMATRGESEPLNKEAAAPPSAQPSIADESVEAPKTPEVSQSQTEGYLDSTKVFKSVSETLTNRSDLVSCRPSPKGSSPIPIPMKGKPPSVKDGQEKRGSIASDSLDFRISTPKSTRTATSLATSWATNPYTTFSPQATTASEPSTGYCGKQGSAVASRPANVVPYLPPTQAQAISTHAHPSPVSSSTISKDIQTRRGHRITTQKPEGFFWQLDSHGFPCAKSDCDSRCNLWDGATVICPKCGPYSETRYCSRQHLLEDIKAHWVLCGSNTFQHPCRESTIPKDVRDGPPLIRCLHPYDTPERHRQAVYFNMHSSVGDYFIFSDWIDILEAGFPDDNSHLRCSTRIIYVVKFVGPSEKDCFRRVLAACLFATLETHELTDYLFRLIRDKLRTTTLPPTTSLSNLETSLKYQLLQETEVTLRQDITGERHACETDWTGTNRRNCPDPICRSEYRRLLGSLGGRALQNMVNHLEASHWILRAARTTHPDIKDAGKRMKGEGFEDVAEEERRVFCRGDGWDGAGAGEIEVEGINA